MPTVVLRDSEGVDLGFMLVAGKEPLLAGPQHRDVVMMRFPQPSLSALAEFIEAYGHEEFCATIHTTPEGASLAFSVSSDRSVMAEFNSTGAGVWSVSAIGSGACHVLERG